ncbi:MAG: hypothetical protein ACI9A7_001937 [Cyclobacteriaceae bacterium]|jgi:hypothetical protein
MNIDGKITEKFDTQEISASFKKREFVIEFAENPTYPEYIKLETIQANCDQLNNIQVGDDVSIAFNLKGRKWTDPQGNTKYFNTLQAWRIEKKSANQTNTPPPPSNQETPPPPSEEGNWVKEDFSGDDDLPF